MSDRPKCPLHPFRSGVPLSAPSIIPPKVSTLYCANSEKHHLTCVAHTGGMIDVGEYETPPLFSAGQKWFPGFVVLMDIAGFRGTIPSEVALGSADLLKGR